MLNFTPLYDWIVVKPLPLAEQHNGIHIPEVAQFNRKQAQQGIVVACGRGDKLTVCACESFPQDVRDACPFHDESGYPLPSQDTGQPFRLPMHVKVGDHILYEYTRSGEVTIDGEKFMMMHEEQFVLAVIEQ